MRIIGENIHILSPKVKEALANRDKKFFQESAVRQVEAGAWAVDLNVGPQKKLGHEILPWLVDAVQEVVDVPLSLDTTNLTAIEAACEIVKNQPFINSTSAEPERLEKVPLVAKKYNTRLVALTMESEGIPVSADARVNIALEKLLPRAEEVGLPISDMFIDPLVLTVSGCQQYVPECIEAVRILQVAGDPPPGVVVGLSNVSNAVPNEMRPLINRVYCVMLMGAGLSTCIADPLDKDLREFIRVVEGRDESSSLNRLLLNLHDAVQVQEELQADQVDFSDPEQLAIWKTVQILLNKVIYADSYLRV
jgi:5-methyltetrahydrofolate corrinoid/iron sulfur protein methyltransferase